MVLKQIATAWTCIMMACYIISSFQNSGSDYVEISGLENYFNLHKGSMCCDQS